MTNCAFPKNKDKRLCGKRSVKAPIINMVPLQENSFLVEIHHIEKRGRTLSASLVRKYPTVIIILDEPVLGNTEKEFMKALLLSIKNVRFLISVRPPNLLQRKLLKQTLIMHLVSGPRLRHPMWGLSVTSIVVKCLNQIRRGRRVTYVKRQKF